MTPERFTRTTIARWGWEATAFASLMTLYACSLDSDAGFWDTGEMNTVPYVLGLAHPTGYPTEILAGWIFSHVFAAGSVAFRLTLLNALEVAVAGALACAFIRAETRTGYLGLLGALLFGTNRAVWHHATHTDVVSATTVCCAATFVVTRRWLVWGNARALLAAGLLGAPALGAHGSSAFYLIAPVVAIGWSSRTRGAWPAIACAGIVIVATAALYAYLPLRAGYVVSHHLDPTWRLAGALGTPIWDWGDPRTPRTFLNVVTGASVGAGRSAANALSFAALPHDTAYGFASLVAALGPAMLVGVLCACACTLAADWALGLFLCAPAILITPFIAGFAAESDPERYYIFPMWCLLVCASIGAARAFTRSRAGARAERLAIGAGYTIAGFAVFAGRGYFDRPRDRLAIGYAAAAVATTESNAIVIAPWVYATPLTYDAYVRHAIAQRLIVAGDAEDSAASVPSWIERAPVYAVAERTPHIAAVTSVYVCSFEVNPDAAHDPKLYRLLAPNAAARAQPATNRVPRRCGSRPSPGAAGVPLMRPNRL